MERKPAVAVIFHHIGPYHHARLNAAADRLSVTGIEWPAKGYDRWGAAATPARYHKVSLFPEATDHYPDKDRASTSVHRFPVLRRKAEFCLFCSLHCNDKVIRTRAITFIISASASRWGKLIYLVVAFP
jgi:hypothetical protein